jgi:DNA-binding NarL/FixJ family response regulator
MGTSDAPTNGRGAGACLLVADDDPGVRTIFATLLRATAGVGAVVEAEDGAEAVELARRRRLDIAVLDMNMPRLDGIEAALRLRALQPSLQIALHSSDPELLRQRAAGLELPLFDKVDFDRLLAWVKRQAGKTSVASASASASASAALEPKLDLCCSLCGYGIVSRLPPARCPMCGGAPIWAEPLGSTSRRGAVDERLAG